MVPGAIDEDPLGDRVAYKVWAALVTLLVGFATAVAALFLVRLESVYDLGRQRPPLDRRAWWYVVTFFVLFCILAALISNAFTSDPSTGVRLNRHQTPISIWIGVCAIPGLVAFTAIRWVAKEDENWKERGDCKVKLVLRLRDEIRWALATLGGLLTLLVVTAGIRRNALLEYDPNLDEPIEGVLIYGLLFAMILGGFYAAASNAVERRATRIIDDAAAVPDPFSSDVVEDVKRRESLATLLGVTSAWRSFEATVVVAAPLLAALIGAAIDP